jgi:hypothetical protein
MIYINEPAQYYIPQDCYLQYATNFNNGYYPETLYSTPYLRTERVGVWISLNEMTGSYLGRGEYPTVFLSTLRYMPEYNLKQATTVS